MGALHKIKITTLILLVVSNSLQTKKEVAFLMDKRSLTYQAEQTREFGGEGLTPRLTERERERPRGEYVRHCLAGDPTCYRTWCFLFFFSFFFIFFLSLLILAFLVCFFSFYFLVLTSSSWRFFFFACFFFFFFLLSAITTSAAAAVSCALPWLVGGGVEGRWWDKLHDVV